MEIGLCLFILTCRSFSLIQTPEACLDHFHLFTMLYFYHLEKIVHTYVEISVSPRLLEYSSLPSMTVTFMLQVDAHNLVPCWVASPKLEYGARTIRNKIHNQLSSFLTEYPPVCKHKYKAKMEPKVSTDKFRPFMGSSENSDLEPKGSCDRFRPFIGSREN